VFTWDYETAAPVWEAFKSQPVLSDEVQAFKTLIAMHKIVRDGHKSALSQAIKDINFLDLLGRAAHFNSHGAYSALIDAYIRFLRYKLEFHTIHLEFTANMDYEEYRALRKVDDPNEG
jgi:hypothetical protein